MANASKGGPPERSYVSSMFDDDSRYSGNLFVDGSLVTPMKPLWPVQGTRLKQFDSVLRVLPGKQDDGNWSNFRTGTGKGEYGRWMYGAWAVRSIGDPAVTFFLCSDKDTIIDGYDPRQHPCYVLYNGIFWAVENGNKHVQAHWAPMVTSKQRRVIKKPGPMFLVQCLVYGRGEKMYDPPMGTDDGEKVVCFDLASDGGKALRSLLDKRRDPNDALDDAATFADYYKYGDITAFDGGKFVQIFPANYNPNQGAATQAPQGPRRSLSKAAVAAGRSRAQSKIDDEKDRVGYEVAILDEYQGWDPGIDPDLAAALEPKIYPWPDIVKVPDHKTAASYLWSRMRFGGELKLDVLLYAWQDHPDWLPDKDSDVWHEWIHRTQVAPGGYDPNAGQDDDDDDDQVDRRPRQRAGDAAERADDQPRPTRRAGARPVEQAPPEEAPEESDDEPPPRRAGRVAAAQTPAAPSGNGEEEKPLKGRVGRNRVKMPTAAESTADHVDGGKAASDVATAASSFRPSAAAADDDDDDASPIVDKAGGFAEPPAATTPKVTPKAPSKVATKPAAKPAQAAAAPAAKPAAAPATKDPKDILAAARAKFTGAS